MSVRIIVDSSADVAERFQKRLCVVPLTIHFGSEELIDGVTIDKAHFYQRLVESDQLPTTSQATPAAFQKVYEQTVQAGDSAVVITLSGKLSGTYQSACIAAEEFDHVYVVDSQTAAIGTGILAEYALSCVDAGMPVVTVRDGEVVLIGKARGSKQGNNLLAEKIHTCGGIDFSLPILLGYSGLSDAFLKKYVEDSRSLWQDGAEKLDATLISGVIGTHTGPGVVAAAFFRKH